MGDRIPKIPPKIAAIEEGAPRPLWSVMIPTYNCIGYIEEAINSVLKQDPGNEKMEIEVVDDHSTDGDVEALVKRVGNGRVKFFRQEENRGSLRNFETCINRSRGQWLHILHGDDKVLKGFYDEIQSLFLRYPKAGAAFTNNCFIDNKGQEGAVLKKLSDDICLLDNFLTRLAKYQQLQPPAIVVKRTVYEKLGSFFAVHFGEDWEMWTRISAHYPMAYSPKCLAAYRTSTGNNISHLSFETGQNISDLIKVINIIEENVPPAYRKKNKKESLQYYAIFCFKIANAYLATNKEVAHIQASGAWKMYRSITSLYWYARFYLMDFLKVKKIQRYFLRSN